MPNYGGYYSAVPRDSSLIDVNKTATLGKKSLNLNKLLQSNLLEEDGIEDLHFYFVSFNQHKKLIMNHQRASQKPPAKPTKGKKPEVKPKQK